MKIAKLALLATFAGGLMAVAAPANATTTVTFAQFAQKVSSQKIFDYTALGGGAATLNSSGATVLIANLGLLVTPALANFTMSSSSTGAPVSNPPFVQQFFSGMMNFTLITPQGGMTNALTVTFTNAVLVAKVGGSSPVFVADTSAGSTISYSSDFADLSSFLDKNFSLSFSSASAPAALDGGGNLPSFHISGTGTFAGTSVPEPATWALMLGGFGLAGLSLRSRATKNKVSYTV